MALTGSIAQLLSLASNSLVDAPPLLSPRVLRLAGDRAEELAALLRERNGFYAFESALHVFPAAEKTGVMDLEQWNSEELWRRGYGTMGDRCLFFAEDLYGFPFALRDGSVFSMDAETGKLTEIAKDLEGWAKLMLAEHPALVGQAIARQWQEMRGPIAAGKRLFPGQLFALGGKFEVANLAEVDAIKAMKLRGSIARQIGHLPKGTKIELKFK